MWPLLINAAFGVDVCTLCAFTEVDPAIRAGHTEIVLTDARAYLPFSVDQTAAGQVSVSATVAASVEGGGGPAVFIDGGDVVLDGFEITSPGASAIRLVGDTAALELVDVTVRDSGGPGLPVGGAVALSGGGVLTVRGGAMHDNQAIAGGAIGTQNGTGAVVSLVDAELRDNQAVHGGAVHLFDGHLELAGGTRLSNNEAQTFGGAVDVEGGSVVTSGVGSAVVFEDNRIPIGAPAGPTGGAIRATAGALLTLEDVTFLGNEAPDGGALWVDGGAMANLVSATFDGNAAQEVLGNLAGRGGAIGVGEEGDVTTANATFVGNSALRGGHVHTSATYADLGSSFLLGSALVGGAIHGSGIVGPKQDFSVSLLGSVLEANGAVTGSGIDAVGPGRVGLDAIHALGHRADRGGFLHVSGTTIVTVSGSVFDDNATQIGPGGHLFFSDVRDVQITDSFMGRGSSAAHGGSVFGEFVDSMFVSDSVFDLGSAAGSGGAIGLIQVDDVQLERNAYCSTTAQGFGGAVDLLDSCAAGGLPCLITNEGYEATYAAGSGGAVSVRRSLGSQAGVEVDLDHLTARGTAPANLRGAALHTTAGVTLTLKASLFDLGSGSAFDFAVPPERVSYVNVNPRARALVGDVTTFVPQFLQFADPQALACADGLRLHPASHLVGFVPEPDGTFSDIGRFDGPLRDEGWFVDVDRDSDPWVYDCDETDDTVGGTQPESCINDRDDDCDAVVDEQSGPWSARWIDRDRDRYGDGQTDSFQDCGPLGNRQAARGGDCDDDDFDRFPGAPELCDGRDQDCNGLVDDQPVNGIDGLVDRDGDGFAAEGPPVLVCEGSEHWVDPRTPGPRDCDDADGQRYPGATEISDDGIDQDCSGDDLVSSWSGGGGCASAGGPVGGLLGAIPLSLLLRRRRRRRRL